MRALEFSSAGAYTIRSLPADRIVRATRGVKTAGLPACGEEPAKSRRAEMRIIVPSQDSNRHQRNCSRAITECALCSEDPRFCGDWE